MEIAIQPKPVFDKCSVCKYEAFFYEDGSQESVRVDCLRCGLFRITMQAYRNFKEKLSTNIYLLASSKINELARHKHVYTEDDIEKLSKTSIPSVDERAINLLKCFAEHYPQIGSGPLMRDIKHFSSKAPNIEEADFERAIAKFVYQSLSRSYSNNKEELDYLFMDYHILETKFINKFNNKLEISPKGWARLDELKIKIQESNIGFIAMKFTDKLEKYADKWFKGGIKDAGYEAAAMYSHQHTNLIDNEMIAQIKRSKFLVCDLTYNSSGAYYEAGFAHGLDKPVMFLCEKKFFKDNGGVHFDTNHYPIRFWEYDKGKELRNELKNWIESTVGRGLFENK